MSYDVKFSAIINAPRPEVFNYFTNSALLENWCYPDGMTLNVPYFENNLHGKYRYEHKDNTGKLFICEGVIEGYETNRRLVTIDHVETSSGEVLIEQSYSDVQFFEDAGGCRIEIYQKGFDSEQMAQECKIGWEQCLNRLNSLFEQFSQQTL